MCVLWNWELKSIILVQRRYRMQYGKDPPTHQSILHWCWQFQATGSVLHCKRAGRPSVSDIDVTRVNAAFLRSPLMSIRRASLELQIPRSTVQKVLHTRLKMFPYKLQIVQALLPQDKPKRMAFAVDMLDRILIMTLTS